MNILGNWFYGWSLKKCKDILVWKVNINERMYAMFLDGYFEIEWRVKKFFCDDDILSKLSDNYLMHDEMGDLGGFQQLGRTHELWRGWWVCIHLPYLIIFLQREIEVPN